MPGGRHGGAASQQPALLSAQRHGRGPDGGPRGNHASRPAGTEMAT